MEVAIEIDSILDHYCPSGVRFVAAIAKANSSPISEDFDDLPGSFDSFLDFHHSGDVFACSFVNGGAIAAKVGSGLAPGQG